MKNLFQIMNDTNLMIGRGDFLSAAETFLDALKQNPSYAWDNLWKGTPWKFYTSLVPMFIDDYDNLHIRSKIACVNTCLYLGEYERALALIPPIERYFSGNSMTTEMRMRAHAGVGHFYTSLLYAERLEAINETNEYYEEGFRREQVSPLKEFELAALFELGDDDRFEGLIDELLFINPHSPDLYLHKSFWLRDRGRYREGLAASETALEMRPSAMAFFQHGWFRRALGDSRAVTDFHAFLAMPADSTRDYYLPFVYCYLGWDKRARQSMMDNLAEHPESPDAYILCAEIFSLLNDTEMAVLNLEQAFKHGFVSRAGLYADPALQSVRDTAEGKELILSRLRTLEREDMRAASEISYMK